MAETPQAAPLLLTDDEKQQRLKNGKPLDFAPAPPSEESGEAQAARTIQASWIAELAERHTLRITVPLDISGAIIEGPLLLQYAVFECGVAVRDCEFRGTVDLQYAKSSRGSVFRGSVFKEDVLLGGAQVSPAFWGLSSGGPVASILQYFMVESILAAAAQLGRCRSWEASFSASWISPMRTCTTPNSMSMGPTSSVQPWTSVVSLTIASSLIGESS